MIFLSHAHADGDIVEYALRESNANRYRIFISSIQRELAEERRTVKDFITHDPLLSR